MGRLPEDSRVGALHHVERPLRPAVAWALMIGPVVVIALTVLAVNATAWPLSLALLVMLVPASVLIFCDRLLIEQRLHDRAIVSRTRLPLRPTWFVPMHQVDPETVAVEGRVSWEADHEEVLPASGVLRSLPWGRVVRVSGPLVMFSKVARGAELPMLVEPTAMAHHTGATDHGTVRWAFSFRDPEAAAEAIRGLARNERERLDRLLDDWRDPGR